MRFIIVTLILMFAIWLSFQSCAFAQEEVKVEDMIIGSIFKGLAKVYVTVTDMNKLKKDNIDKLNKMDMEKFQKRYAKIYEVIKAWPPTLKSNYRVTEHMTREQAIKNIESFDKKKIYEMIDAIPDTIITKQFKKYLSEEKQEMQKSNLAEQINKFWNKMLEKVN